MLNKVILLGALAAFSPAAFAAPAGITATSSLAAVGPTGYASSSAAAAGPTGYGSILSAGGGATTYKSASSLLEAGPTVSSSAAAASATKHSGVQPLSDPGQTYGAPPTLTGADGATYNLIGCYIDRPDEQGRALPDYKELSDDNSNYNCVQHATSQAPFTYIATEHGNECRAGYNIPSWSTNTGHCDSLCTGNANERCGGYYAQAVYQRQGDSNPSPPAPSPAAPATVVTDAGTYDLVGCYTDQTDSQGRALTDFYSNNADNNTPERCGVQVNGLTYFATEYGYECRGGNVLGSFSQPTGTCDKVCSGNSTEICGGQSYSMSLYKIRS